MIFDGSCRSNFEVALKASIAIVVFLTRVSSTGISGESSIIQDKRLTVSSSNKIAQHNSLGQIRFLSKGNGMALVMLVSLFIISV